MATTLDEATIAREANRRVRRSANIAGWAFASPSVIIVLGLSFIPMIWAAYLSLRTSTLFPGAHFIGSANSAPLARAPLLRQAFTTPLLLAVLSLPIGLAAGLGVAILLNQKIKLIGFYRTCFLVPFVASAAAEGLLFAFIFDSDFGLVNAGVQAVGVPRPGFPHDPSHAAGLAGVGYFR